MILIAIIRSIWSPKICLLERRVNIHKLHDTRFNSYEKGVTFEGADYHSTSEPVKGSILAGEIQHTCHQVVDHIAEVSFHKYRIARMVLNLKVDAQDRVWLLWSTCIRIEECNPSTAPKKAMPINIDTKLKLPQYVDLSTTERLDGNVKIERCPCTSCAILVDKRTKAHEVNYKAIVSHFDQLVQYWDMQNLYPHEDDDDYDNSEARQKHLWPPSDKAIAAAGNVGFGILKYIDRPMKESLKLKLNRMIPPSIQYLHPGLDCEDYMRFKSDPIFLYKTALMCDSCFLVYADFSTSNLASNALHHNAPVILRPPRTRLLDPICRDRRSPATAWTPLRNNMKPSSSKSSVGFHNSSSKQSRLTPTHHPIPEIPGRIDPKLLRELDTGKQYVTRPKTSDTTSDSRGHTFNASKSSTELLGTTTTFERGRNDSPSFQDPDVPSYLREREEEFFNELYSNPHMDQSHPLSHMIESASRVQLGNAPATNLKLSPSRTDLEKRKKIMAEKKKKGKKKAPGRARTKFQSSLKTKTKTKTTTVSDTPDYLKQLTSSSSGTSKVKVKVKKTINGAKRASSSNVSLAITASAQDHREFLLTTLGHVRDQLEDTSDLDTILGPRSSTPDLRPGTTASSSTPGFRPGTTARLAPSPGFSPASGVKCVSEDWTPLSCTPASASGFFDDQENSRMLLSETPEERRLTEEEEEHDDDHDHAEENERPDEIIVPEKREEYQEEEKENAVIEFTEDSCSGETTEERRLTEEEEEEDDDDAHPVNNDQTFVKSQKVIQEEVEKQEQLITDTVPTVTTSASLPLDVATSSSISETMIDQVAKTSTLNIVHSATTKVIQASSGSKEHSPVVRNRHLSEKEAEAEQLRAALTVAKVLTSDVIHAASQNSLASTE